jgi:hypothetical protein
MAVARESVHQSPGQGQYALSTCVEVVCENHKNTRAVLKLSGNFSIEYSQDAGLTQRQVAKRGISSALYHVHSGAVVGRKKLYC